MAAQTEAAREADFIISEGSGTYSRDEIVLADITSTETLAAGTVLGQITASGKYIPRDDGAGDGSEVAAGVLLAAVDMVSGADSAGVIFHRQGEVNDSRLTYDSGGEATARTELAAAGIIVRLAY